MATSAGFATSRHIREASQPASGHGARRWSVSTGCPPGAVNIGPAARMRGPGNSPSSTRAPTARDWASFAIAIAPAGQSTTAVIPARAAYADAEAAVQEAETQVQKLQAQLAAAQAELEQRVQAESRAGLRLQAAALGNGAGRLGAARLAQQRLLATGA